MNYYEILKVPSTASTGDIQTVLDRLYNQWRGLVAHHDPKVAADANNWLMTIEQMRATLTNPVKRAEYDRALMVNVPGVGGVADPTFRSGNTGMGNQNQTLNRNMMGYQGGATMVIPAPVRQTPEQRTDIWECPKCKRANPVNTYYCGKCGFQLSANCPRCGKLTQTSSNYCSGCGVDIKSAIVEQRREKEKQQRSVEATYKLMPINQLVNSAESLSGLWWMIFLGGFAFLLWGNGLSKIRKVLATERIDGDEFIRERAIKLKNKLITNITILLVLHMVVFIIGVISSL